MYPHPFGGPMHQVGGHPGMFMFGLLIRLIVFAIFWLIPVIVGFTYIRRDANRRGQPGWLWALACVFLTWLSVLAYLIVRSFSAQAPAAQVYMPPQQPVSPPPHEV